MAIHAPHATPHITQANAQVRLRLPFANTARKAARRRGV